MSSHLKIDATPMTPGIILDKENAIFEITGRSLPENARSFYSPVMTWVEEYVKNPNDQTVFSLNLDYFNSDSAKQLVHILMKLEAIIGRQKSIAVKWYYRLEDEIMKKKGMELQHVLELPFEMKTLP